MRGWTIAGTVAGVIGAAAGVLSAAPVVRGWIYPLPLILVLAFTSIGLLAYILASRRKPSSADQQRLDRLFGVLTRQAIRRIDAEDFGISWRDDLAWPAHVVVNELDTPEERFDTRVLERRRRTLMAATRRFVDAEGENGFASPVRDRRRNIGWSSGQLDTLGVIDPEQAKLAERRRSAIHQAAGALVEAHAALVVAAKRRGFRLEALARPAPEPPWP